MSTTSQMRALPNESPAIETLVAEFGSARNVPHYPKLRLDDPRVRTLGSMGFDDEAIINWVNQDDPVLHRNRQQLLQSFPLILPALAAEGAEENPTFMALSASIDRGNPLIDAFSRIMGVSRSTAKYIMGLQPDILGTDWVREPIQLTWAVSQTPIPCRPTSPSEWQLYRRYWVLSGLAPHHDYANTPESWQVRNPLLTHLFVLLCRNGYSNAAQRRLLKMTDGHVAQIIHARDYFDFVVEWAWSRWPGADAVELCAALLMRYSLADLIRQSLHWHELISREREVSFLPERVSSEDHLGSWPPLLEEPFEHAGLHAISLVCTNDLVEEGRHMESCVSRYVESCVSGESHILSIRDATGKSLSTVEIEVYPWKQDQWEGAVRQHYGPGNGPPSDECIRLVDLLLIALKQSCHQPWLQRIREIHDQRRETLENHLWDLKQSGLVFNEKTLSNVLPDFDHSLKWLCQKADALDEA